MQKPNPYVVQARRAYNTPNGKVLSEPKGAYLPVFHYIFAYSAKDAVFAIDMIPWYKAVHIRPADWEKEKDNFPILGSEDSNLDLSGW